MVQFLDCKRRGQFSEAQFRAKNVSKVLADLANTYTRLTPYEDRHGSDCTHQEECHNP